MRVNENTFLATSKVLLVPYSTHHVPTYHGWMKDPDLQAATASEPLSLDDEYAMQKSWRTDHDKLTFVVHSRPSSSTDDAILNDMSRSSANMIGDINLFLFTFEDDDDRGDVGTPSARTNCVVGEIELMIACKDHRGKGYGRAALSVFVYYLVDKWSIISREFCMVEGSVKCEAHLRYLRAKIQGENVSSINLFESLGFAKVDPSPNYFGEYELRWTPDVTTLQQQKGWEEYKSLAYSSS